MYQHYKKNDTRTTAQNQIIQRKGELMATRSTFSRKTSNPAGRTGITPTRLYHANIWSEIHGSEGRRRMLLNHKLHEWYIQYFRDVFRNYYIEKHRSPCSDEITIFAEAELIRLSDTAICDDFATVTYTHLIDHTTDQWVYHCSMAGSFLNDRRQQVNEPCHSFTITSPYELNISSGLLNSNTLAQLDQATVVDGWAQHSIMPLSRFLHGCHPYGGILQQENVKINSHRMANGFEILTDQDKRFIKSEFDIFKNDFDEHFTKKCPEVKSLRTSGAIFGERESREKMGRDIHDLRPDADILLDKSFQDWFPSADHYFLSDLYPMFISLDTPVQSSALDAWLENDNVKAFIWPLIKKLLYTEKDQFILLYPFLREKPWFLAEYTKRFTYDERVTVNTITK